MSGDGRMKLFLESEASPLYPPSAQGIVTVRKAKPAGSEAKAGAVKSLV